MNKSINDWGSGSPAPWNFPDPQQDTPSGDPRSQLSEEFLTAAGHNGFPVVAKQKSARDGLGLAAGALIALGLGAVTFLTLGSSREPGLPSQATQAHAVAAQAPQLTTNVPQTVAQMGAVPPVQLRAPSAPAAAPSTPMAMAPSQTLLRESPVVVFDGTGTAGPAVSAPASSEKGLLEGSSASASEGSSPANRSTPLADPSTTVVQGTLIPAVLETAINSDVPGLVRAVVTQDVRSFDGSRVLIPRSSRLMGEYKLSASGQHRIYLMWTRLMRPDGVSIALSSPATDAEGRAGIGGHVNTHFFERLGSALLTSVLGAVNPFGRSGATVVVSGGEGAASTALLGAGQRAPTIRVPQGEPIRVFTAHDLVFTPTDGDK